MTICQVQDIWKLAWSCCITMPTRPMKFTRYCLTQWILKLLWSLKIHWNKTVLFKCSFIPNKGPVNIKVKVMGKVTQGKHHPADSYPYILFHINWPIHAWNITILKFDLVNPKVQCQVMVEVKVHGCTVGSASYPTHLFLFHVNQPPHSWDMATWKNDLENSSSRSWVRWKVKATYWIQQPMDSHPFLPCHLSIPFLEYGYFKIWPWKSKVKVIAGGHIVGPTS